jgi:pyruvate/2-oxoglutarate dehydrogenase complex dihydrolipoamide dehydrogenase (E3) component
MSGDHNQFQKGKSYVDEPIAWMHTTGTGHVYFRKKPQDKVFNPQPVYTSPKREWVGLTLNEAEDFYDKYTDRAELINAIDKFLAEKNHG